MVKPVQSKGPSTKRRGRFCVVSFIESPQQHVDKYVCLPSSWLYWVSDGEGRVIAAYPPVEHPKVTRHRVLKGEKYGEDWLFHLATIKHQCNSYNDAEKWIASRNNKESSSDLKDPQPDSVERRTLRSTTRCLSSNPTKDNNQSQMKTHKNKRKPLPRMIIKRLQLPNSTMEAFRKFIKGNDSTPSKKPDENNSSNMPGTSKQWTIDNTFCLADTDDSNVDNVTEKDITASVRIDDKLISQPSVSNTIQPISSKTYDKICDKSLSMPSIIVNDGDLVTVEEENQPESIATRPSSTQNSPEQQYQLAFIQERYPNESLVEQFKNQYLLEVTAKDPKPVRDKAGTNSGTTTVLTTNSKTMVNKSTELNQFTPLPAPTISGLSYRDFKLRKIRGERFTEEFHEEPNDQATSNIPCSSQNLANPQLDQKDTSPLLMCPVENQAKPITEYQEEVPPDNTHSIQSNINNKGLMPTNTAQNSLIDKRHVTASAVNPADLDTCHQDNITETSISRNHSDSAYQLRWSMQPLNTQYLPQYNSEQIPRIEDISRIPSEINYQNQNPFDKIDQILAKFQSNSPYPFLQHNENQQMPINRNHLQQDKIGEGRPTVNSLSNHTYQRLQTTNGLEETSPVQNHICLQNEPQRYSQLLQQGRAFSSNEESRSPIAKGPNPGFQVTEKTPLVASTSADSVRQSSQNVQRRNLTLDHIRKMLNERSTEHEYESGPVPRHNIENYKGRSPPQYTMTKPLPSTSNFKTQPTPVRGSHETHSEPDYQSPMYINPRTFKLVVDRATKTDTITKRVRFEEDVVESPVMKKPRMVSNGATQTDVSLRQNTQHKFIPRLNSVNDRGKANKEMTAEKTLIRRNNGVNTPFAINSLGKPRHDTHKSLKIQATNEVLESFAKFDASFGEMVSNLSKICNSFLDMQRFVQKSVQQMKGSVKAYQASL